jgi:N-carbamoyl-L-amino-acid hydrolase
VSRGAPSGPIARDLLEALEELSAIGRRGESGYWRFAWSEEDAAARRWFAAEAARREMALECDRNGNLWAWWGDSALEGVATGSHLDSVPGGGALDGPLGVISGFLAVDELRRRGATLGRRVGVVCFADEEGGRFGLACVGSRLLCGALAPEQARALTDSSGVTLETAMRAAGVDPERLGRDDERLGRLKSFVEVHIEQGVALADREAPIGIATSIWPHGRWRYEIEGEANHAGTTRLADRHDPMLCLADLVLAARAAALAAGGLATIGRVVVEPNATNAIAHEVTGWLDARAPSTSSLEGMLVSVRRAAEESARVTGVAARVVEESFTPGVAFNEELIAVAGEACGELPRLATGAGHDAGILAGSIPTAMLFIRNPSGVSHAPSEGASTEDCVAGVLGLTAMLARLCA